MMREREGERRERKRGQDEREKILSRKDERRKRGSCKRLASISLPTTVIILNQPIHRRRLDKSNDSAHHDAEKKVNSKLHLAFVDANDIVSSCGNH